jgi:hypothetical protein
MQRRNALKYLGASFISAIPISKTVAAEEGTAVPPEPDDGFDSGGGDTQDYSDSATAEDGYYGAIDIGSGVHEYNAVSEEGANGQGYWKLRYDTFSHAQTRSNDSKYVFTPRTISPLSRKLLLTQQ